MKNGAKVTICLFDSAESFIDYKEYLAGKLADVINVIAKYLGSNYVTSGKGISSFAGNVQEQLARVVAGCIACEFEKTKKKSKYCLKKLALKKVSKENN